MEAAKVSDNWRLNKILQRIRNNIEFMEGLHFQAMRREGNMLVDRLANEGTTWSLRLRSRSWNDMEEGYLHQHYEAINAKEN